MIGVKSANEGITEKVSRMYERFPYPSPETGTRKLKELSNLLTIFSRETGYDFRDKTVLDAGTGTGHRLLEAARLLKGTRFLAVDVSERPLSIARETAKLEGIENVEFRSLDLMDENFDLGQFDVILCMGVLHHLADTTRGLRNLVRHLPENGLLFFYVYGEHGSRERLQRKEVISLLLGEDRHNFDRGLEIVKEMGFANSLYGWNLNIQDENTRDSLFVDAYLNVHERLFTTESLCRLVKEAGLDGFATFGITVAESGYLFDSRVDAPAEVMLQRTDIARKLPSASLLASYQRMSLLQRYLLLDLLYQPNGYTVVAFKSGARALFKPQSRIMENAIWTAEI